MICTLAKAGLVTNAENRIYNTDVELGILLNDLFGSFDLRNIKTVPSSYKHGLFVGRETQLSAIINSAEYYGSSLFIVHNLWHFSEL